MARLMTTNEAAASLGIQPQSVRALINRGVLPARRFGRDFVIDERELLRYKEHRRKPGRPAETKE